MSRSRNDEAWEKIFARWDALEQIRENGVFRVSADQIREYREPRLMAKFDHRVNLPDAMIFLSSCDKALPGHLIALARLNVPALVIPGGAQYKALLQPGWEAKGSSWH